MGVKLIMILGFFIFYPMNTMKVGEVRLRGLNNVMQQQTILQS